MGAAVQGGLIAGIDVGPILVDITPHTLGIEALGELHGFMSTQPLLADHRTQHAAARQPDRDLLDGRRRSGGGARSASSRARTRTRATTPWSASSTIEGLAEVPAGNQILVRLDLDLSGILKVTATERATGLAKHVVIDNAMERFRKRQRSDAVDRLEAVMGGDEESESGRGARPARRRSEDGDADRSRAALGARSRRGAAAKAERVLPEANAEDADELRAMLADLSEPSNPARPSRIRSVLREVEDLVFYLES